MKSTWFKNPHGYTFMKAISEAYGWNQSNYTMVCEWCEAAFMALYNTARFHTCGKLYQPFEDRYSQILKKIKYPEKVSEALVHVVNALEEKPHDFLGTVLGDLAVLDSAGKGQVFTPYELSYVSAKMILHEADVTSYSMFKKMRLSEPACGGGSMIIAATQVLREMGMSQNHYVFHATDIDFKCVCISYIQLTLLDIPAIITHGNELSRERWGVYPTFALNRSPDYGEGAYCCLI